MKVSVVIPCFRSEDTLPLLVSSLIGELKELETATILNDFEINLVVDGSPDSTGIAARAIADNHQFVNVFELQRNFGQHNALIAGIREATGDVIVTLDDDLQHPPSEIRKILEPLLRGEADLVYAVPEVEEHGFLRSLASRVVKRGLKVSGVSNADWVGAFRAFRTSLRDGFALVDEPTVNLDVLLSWTTTRVTPVTVEMMPRVTGESGYGLVKLFRHTLNMVTGYSVAPLRWAAFLGFSVSLLGFGILATELTKYFLGENIVAGFTTTIALVSVFSGVQLITIGLIGEYLGRMYFRSMRKPMYLVRK